MANNCWYSMKIVGDKKNCDEFIKRLNSYEEPNHFWRIFSAEIYGVDYGIDDNDKNKVAMYIDGDCAWSLESCCRASGYSNGVDLFAVNTKELDLEMEAYSREPGMCFEEHYIYKRGNCFADECLDINVYWWDTTEFPTFEEFKKEYPDAPSIEHFEENNEAIVGGFEKNYENWHI